MSKSRNGQNAIKPVQKGNYNVRALKYYQQNCAYHPAQLITNFCKNEECLLPVCPTCIKLHSDEHKINRTSSNFEEIAKVITQIEATYKKMSDLAEKVKQLLVDIEGNKKQNQSKIREKLIQHRNVLIKQFQSSLIQIQNNLIEAIVQDDKVFIRQIQKIDEQLSKVHFNLKRDVQILHSDEILKRIILYYSQKSGEIYQRQLEFLKRRSEDLNKKSIIVTVDEGELTNMCRAISKYMNIQITDWSNHKQS